MAPAERAAVREAVDAVISGSTWVLGEQVSAFEAEFGEYVGSAHAVGVASGTDALVLALLGLGLPAGSELLIPPDDGGYAATAARLADLVPVAYDTLDSAPSIDAMGDALSPRTSGVVITHLHGNPVPLEDLDRWRRTHGLALIEDCAQAAGLRMLDRHVGSTGDAAAFSFYPTKNLGAVGDGGLVVFADRPDAERARALRQYGWTERFRVGLPSGRNSRLDEVQAAVLRARLPFLDARNSRRRLIARRYGGVVDLLGAATGSVHHHAVALLADRESVAAALAVRGVGTAVHYPWLVTEMPGLGIEKVPLPGASRMQARKLTLPCFPELTDHEVQRVLCSLEELLR